MLILRSFYYEVQFEKSLNSICLRIEKLLYISRLT